MPINSSVIHPTVLLISFVVIALSVINVSDVFLFAMLVPVIVLAFAITDYRNYTVRAIYRLKWFWLSIMLVYALLSNNGPQWHVTDWLSLNINGLQEGITRCLSLIVIIAYFSMLALKFDQQRWLHAIYVLLWPLKFIGIKIETIALRLSMTLTAIEKLTLQQKQQPATNEQISIGQRLQALATRLRTLFNDVDQHYDPTPVNITIETPVLWQWIIPAGLFFILSITNDYLQQFKVW